MPTRIKTPHIVEYWEPGRRDVKPPIEPLLMHFYLQEWVPGQAKPKRKRVYFNGGKR
jgi:hypothetical protein